MAVRLFTLVRHGKVNGRPALYGHTDIELSPDGRTDIECAIERVNAQQSIDAIIASPLIRCAHTAQHFSTEYNIPLLLEPQLREMHFGTWDGIPFDDMPDDWALLEAFWKAPFYTHPPNGETLANVAQRVISAWNLIAKNSTLKHQLIICHGGVIRIILAHILQMDWRNASLYQQLHIDYASTSRIEISDAEGALAIVKWIGATTPEASDECRF